MDKLMMNKLDDMEMELNDKELDMVVGGAVKGSPSDSDSTFSPLEKAMEKALVNGGKAVVNGVKSVGKAVDNLLVKLFGPPRKR